MSVLARWKARRAIRLAMLNAARARYRARKTPANVALVKMRRAQVAQADRVIARHQAAPVTGVSEACIAKLKELEGFSATRYDDGVGVQTIGYGTTNADVSPLPAKVTKAQADALLRRGLEHKYVPPVLKALAHFKPTQNEVDACVLFAYNLGEGAFQGAPRFETLTRALRGKSPRAVAEAFLLYDNPHDPAVHEGLKRRRRYEHDLFLKGA